MDLLQRGLGNGLPIAILMWIVVALIIAWAAGYL